jgi:hypothetical protein
MMNVIKFKNRTYLEEFMIIKILGIFDIFVALCFWVFGIFHLSFMSHFIFILGCILLVKGIIFLTGLSIASVLDIIASFALIGGASTFLPNIVVIIVTLFLIQKGAFSLLS